MRRPISMATSVTLILLVAACEPSQQSLSTVAPVTTATPYAYDAPGGALIANRPTESVGQIILQEAIKTLGAAVRGGIALAIDQKFNQNSNGSFDPYPPD